MPDEPSPRRRITRADFGDARVLDLIDLHLAGMRGESPPESVHALDRSGLTAADVELFVLHEDGAPVGMGALRDLGEGVFEIKSMRMAPTRLGRGLGRAILEHLILEARGRGARRISLETGSGPAFEPALALYRSHGFRHGPAFGGYAVTAFNQFLHLDIIPEETA